MNNLNRLRSIIRNIHPEWRDDFCVLIEGGDPTDDFMDYFERSEQCVRAFESAICVLDGEEFTHLMREALTELSLFPMRSTDK